MIFHIFIVVKIEYCGILRAELSYPEPKRTTFCDGFKNENNLQFPVGILFFDSLSVICLRMPRLFCGILRTMEQQSYDI